MSVRHFDVVVHGRFALQLDPVHRLDATTPTGEDAPPRWRTGPALADPDAPPEHTPHLRYFVVSTGAYRRPTG